LRKGEGKRIVSYKNIGPRFIARLKSAKERPSLIFSCLEPLSYEVIILIKSRYRDRIAQKLIKDFLEIYNGIRIQASGADLKKLGLEPGPKYKKIFTRILKDKLDGHIKSHAEELELIKKLIKEK